MFNDNQQNQNNTNTQGNPFIQADLNQFFPTQNQSTPTVTSPVAPLMDDTSSTPNANATQINEWDNILKEQSAQYTTPSSTLESSVPVIDAQSQELKSDFNALPIENASINGYVSPYGSGFHTEATQNQVNEVSADPLAQSETENLPTVSEIAGNSSPQEIETVAPLTPISPTQGQEMTLEYLLDLVIEKGASDLHLSVGYPASIRVDSKLQRIGEPLTKEQVKTIIYATLSDSQRELLEVNREVDLSYSHQDKARFRVNAYHEKGNVAAAYRLIPTKIKTIEDLGLPPVLYDFTKIPQGLFLVTGPTGSGKSTTLAAILQEINQNYPKHVITIEDPIEYVYGKGEALVDQRELGGDTHDWSIALRSILRQDPDVVLIGEMRDFETIQAAMTIAETGHLVFATLHTNSAAQSIDRIVDVFPPHQQSQIRTQLAGSLKGILSQRLIPKLGGGREAAIELMIVNPAIQNLIREGKTYQIDNIISTSYDIGMTTLERSLVKMVRQGKITVEMAQEFAIRPDDILKLMKSGI